MNEDVKALTPATAARFLRQILRHYRTTADLSHPEVAELTGIPTPILIRYESATYPPEHNDLNRLLAVYQVTTNDHNRATALAQRAREKR